MSIQFCSCVKISNFGQIFYRVFGRNSASETHGTFLNKDKKVIKKDEMDSRAPNIKPITTYFKETFKESLARKGYRRQIGWTLLGMVFF